MGTFLTVPAIAAVKAGASCPKVGKTSVASGKTFTCVKSGKKMVWNKGVSVAKPTLSAPSKPVQPPNVSSAADFAPAGDCKLSKPVHLKMDDGPMGSVGFPKTSDALPSTGNVRGLILLADFPDVIATNSALTEIKAAWLNSSIPNAEKLFAFSSYGKMKLKVDMSSKVYRLQKQSTYYALGADPSGGPIPNSPPPKLDEAVTDAITAADLDIDFSQYAFVTVATPQSPTLALSGATGMGPNPKQFDGITYTKGDFMPLDSLTPLDKTYRTLNFTHDTGHMLGLMHPYITGEGQPITGAWDIMWNFAYQNDFYGWNKWKLGWINDDQVSCINGIVTSGITQFLSPIGASTSTNKMIVLKLSETTAIAVEVRRKSPFDDLKSSDEGVIVYRVDTTKGQGYGPFTLLSNLSKQITYQNFPNILGTMKPGENVLADGYKISVIESSINGDYVTIGKAG
jgi:M6 family metalloprotease-like protein